MTATQDLPAVRRAFARRIMVAAGRESAPVERAFATVAREDFIGPGPWQVLRAGGYAPTPNADPAHLYDDAPVALIPERSLNNANRRFMSSSSAPPA